MVKHVGIICDGNGRWGRGHQKTRLDGHTEGRKLVNAVIDWCLEMGIPYLSLYVLSRENLKRDPEEVAHLKRLMRELYGADNVQKALDKGVRFHMSGDLSLASEDDRALYEKAMEDTAGCDKLTVLFQAYYSGREDMTQAARRCVSDGVEITEEAIAQRLYSAAVGAPEPELIIRTGGHTRLSGYLPWESTYSELYFTPTLFPDLSKEEFLWACKWFEGIHRPHGGDREPLSTAGSPAAAPKTEKKPPGVQTPQGVPFAKKEA